MLEFLGHNSKVKFHINVHIHTIYLKAFPERFTEVLGDLVDTDTAHGPDSEGSDERVGVLTVL